MCIGLSFLSKNPFPNSLLNLFFRQHGKAAALQEGQPVQALRLVPHPHLPREVHPRRPRPGLCLRPAEEPQLGHLPGQPPERGEGEVKREIRLVDWSGWLVGWLVGWLIGLVGWLVGWLVDWLVGWLIG